MLETKRKPVSVGEMLTEEFLVPMELTQAQLAEAMGVERKHVNQLCNNRRKITTDTAMILARVFGNSPDFWLNLQRRNDLWEVKNTPEKYARVMRARPLKVNNIRSLNEIDVGAFFPRHKFENAACTEIPLHSDDKRLTPEG